MFNLAIDSKLRGCDLVSLRVQNIAPQQNVLTRATIMQKKTARPVTFEISEHARAAVDKYLSMQNMEVSFYLFPGRTNKGGARLNAMRRRGIFFQFCFIIRIRTWT